MAGSTFQVINTNGDARTGKLFGGIETPAPLMYTRRGFPPPFTLKDLDNLGPAFNGLMQVKPSWIFIAEIAPTNRIDSFILCPVIDVQSSYCLSNVQISASDMFDSPGLKLLSQLGEGGLQNFCGFAERDVFLFVSLRDALQVALKYAVVRLAC